mgnify:CR=1 FL=1
MLDRLVSHFGDGHRARLEAGVGRVLDRWTPADGDDAALEAFCRDHYVADCVERRRLIDRLERGVDAIGGHLGEMRRSLRWWSDVRVPEVKAIDDVLATFDPAPDLSEQLYRQKIAFVALLNLDKPDLATMLRDGADWSVDQWVEARLAQEFGPRVPAEVNERARLVGHAAQQWVARFHVPVGGLVDADGHTVMEDSKRALLAHWLVREEIKARYSAPKGDPSGLPAQRALAQVMGRHIDGTIPRSVMEATATGKWDVARNTLDGAPAGELVGPARYEHWLAHRRIAVEFDGYCTEHPTAMARKFELAREIPEREVEELMIALLDSPVRIELASFLKNRIGRALESFDIYVDDIAENRPAEAMNAAVRARFGDERAFQALLPTVLRELGFSEGDSEYLGSHIEVEIARGSGHAMRPSLPQFKAWLRTSRLDQELGWDGFETAMHELGHTIEQVISCTFVSRPTLRGVPNTACTEAFAFLYQSLAKRVLGLEDVAAAERQFALDSVQTLLNACQIAGPSLLELRVWRWLYANPETTPEALRDATLTIADEIWDRFFRRDFGADPYRLMAAYQHMIHHPLYLADYTLGHIMSHQIRSALRGRDLANETRRICALGRLTPDLWMRRAVGAPISVAALAGDAEDGLRVLRGGE